MNVFDGPTHSTVLKTILLPIFFLKRKIKLNVELIKIIIQDIIINRQRVFIALHLSILITQAGQAQRKIILNRYKSITIWILFPSKSCNCFKFTSHIILDKDIWKLEVWIFFSISMCLLESSIDNHYGLKMSRNIFKRIPTSQNLYSEGLYQYAREIST